MKLLLMFVLHSLVIININAQMSIGLRSYYTNINKAEAFVICGDYYRAIQYYDSAFQVPGVQPFAADVYHDAICLSRAKQYNKTIECLSNLVRMGYNLNMLKNNLEFQNCLRSSAGTSFVNNPRRYGSCEIKDTVLKRKLQRMAYADQLYRKVPGYYGLFKDKVDSIDKVNSTDLTKIINEDGFPGETIVGIDSGNIYMQMYQLIILHQCAGPRQIINFSQQIFEALNNGYINNRIGSYLIERSNGTLMEYCTQLVNLCVYDSLAEVENYLELGDSVILARNKNAFYGFAKLLDDEEAQLNINRKRIGLDDLETTRNKLQFCLKDKAFHFYQFSTSIYLMAHKSDYDYFVSHQIPLK